MNIIRILTVLSSLFIATTASAQFMNYQGFLTKTNGDPLDDGQYTVTFNIYDDATAGGLQWGPFAFDGIARAKVNLAGGRFNVVLGPTADGGGTSLTSAFTSGAPRFLGITVGTNPEILPRQQILSSPTALHAQRADHATTATAVGNPGEASAINIVSGKVGIGTEDPDQKLHVEGGRIKVSQNTGGVLELANNTRSNHIFTNSTGDLYLRTDSAAHDVILQATGTQGNVGIGTGSPTAKLHVIGTTSLNGTTFLNGHTDINNKLIINYNGFGFEHKTTNGGTKLHSWLGDTQANFGTNTDDPLYLVTNGSVLNVALLPNGAVGIGTSNPTRGKVEIVGASGDNDLANGFGLLSSTALGTNGIAANDLVSSLYCNHRVIAFEFIAPSDKRIKHVEGRSDAARDLKTLSGIEVTDYQHIDTVTKGDKSYKKVIAQQVETVFPQAVGQMTDAVPDIYKKASVVDGWVKLKTDLKKGERVRLIGSKNEDKVHEVLEIKEDQFRTDFAGKGQAFVYGREVDDFRSVDYEAIAMLNVSATQELHRRLEVQETELAAKTAEISALKERLAGFDKKFAKLERLLDGRSEVIPVSID